MARDNKSATTDVAVVKPAGVPAVPDYGDYNEYRDNPTGRDLVIPFLDILQPMSPQVTEEKVPGVKAGLFFNEVTGQLWDPEPGVPFQPVVFDHLYVEWRPRDEGGGIVNRYLPTDPVITQLIKDNNNSVVKLKLNGNDVIETYYCYGNILNSAGTEAEGFAVVAVKSTSIKPLRAWRTAMQMIKGKPPYFAFRALLSNSKEKNDSGTWWQFKPKPFSASWRESLIDPSTPAGRELLDAGVELQKMVRSGTAAADYARESSARPADDKAPF